MILNALLWWSVKDVRLSAAHVRAMRSSGVMHSSSTYSLNVRVWSTDQGFIDQDPQQLPHLFLGKDDADKMFGCWVCGRLRGGDQAPDKTTTKQRNFGSTCGWSLASPYFRYGEGVARIQTMPPSLWQAMFVQAHEIPTSIQISLRPSS